VVQLARTDPAFLAGDFRDAETTVPQDVIAYQRGDALVLVNTRPREVRVGLKGVAMDKVRDLLTNRIHRGDTVTLRPYGAMVLRAVSGKR